MKLSENVRKGLVYASLGLFFVAATGIWGPTLIGQGRGGGGGGQAGARAGATRDWTADMQMRRSTEPFTLAAVGDMIILRPASNLDDPRFQSAIKIIRSADIGFGNFESLIRDETNFEGPLGGMFGTKEVAADVRAMGFQVVNRAGNHLMDSNQEGLFDTLKFMQQAGLVYGGAGRDLEDARAAHFYESPKGRIGVVGMYGNVGGQQGRLNATYRIGNTGGRPGLNAINLTRSIIVTPDQLDVLRKSRTRCTNIAPNIRTLWICQPPRRESWTSLANSISPETKWDSRSTR